MPSVSASAAMYPDVYADFQSAAEQFGIDWSWGACQIQAESGFNPNVTSYAGAQGPAQFMPGTWAQYGSGSPFDSAAAAQAWGAYMSALIAQFGDYSEAVAAYNTGPGNVSKAIAACGSGWLGCLPTSASNQAQTINYVNSISSCAGGGVPPPAGTGGGDQGDTFSIFGLTLPDLSSLPGINSIEGLPSWALIGGALLLAYYLL